MRVTHKDLPFIRWADLRGHTYYYTSEPGITGKCLKLHIGLITAYIQEGKLIRIWVDSQGYLLDQMMWEFSQLFSLCAVHDAYLEQNECHVRA